MDNIRTILSQLDETWPIAAMHLRGEFGRLRMLRNADREALRMIADNRLLGMSPDKYASDYLAIMDEAIHASDCALHNAPALPVGPCNCGAAVREDAAP
jgi:hypothetical protein